MRFSSQMIADMMVILGRVWVLFVINKIELRRVVIDIVTGALVNDHRSGALQVLVHEIGKVAIMLF
jgi:hypothetical protein